MRISLLLEREPFGQILEETLPRLLAGLTGRPHAVRWYAHARGTARGGEQAWICNPYLNAIFRPTASPHILAPIVREFGRSPRWWRRPFQRAYVAAATRRPTARCLARLRMGVTPPLEDAETLVILGGNHRLRVLDARAGVSHVIAKAGADPALLRAELALRRAEPGLPIPALLRVAPTADWYTEALVHGTPLNRIAGPQRDGGLRRARAELEHLVRRTMTEVAAGEYVNGLVAEVGGALTRAPILAPERKGIAMSARALMDLATRRPAARSIVIAETHGDFQPGNVLADGDAIWLIDWEYTGRRQSGFDVLSWELASRFPPGLARRVRDAASGRSGEPGSWPGLDWTTAAARRRTLAIFLLEELVVSVREHTSPRLRAPLPALYRFLAELRDAARELENLAA